MSVTNEENKEALIANFKERFERIKKDGFSAVPSPKTRVPADYQRQMQRLMEDGVQIGNEQVCLRTLHYITYYRLKGYLLPFRNREKRYKSVKFEKVRNIHEFDNQMRTILLYALSKIEIYLRSQFSFFHSSKYGAYGYLDAANYSKVHQHEKFLDIVVKSVEDNANTLFVRHYLEYHSGVMPFWVMSELLSFGQWHYFYRDMETANQKAFLQQLYGIKGGIAEIKADSTLAESQKESLLKYDMAVGRFKSWLGCCNHLRNVCAHCGRLYDVKFAWNPSIPFTPTIPQGIVKQFVEKGFHRKLFGGILAVMFLYPDDQEWNEKVFPKIKTLLEYYSVRGIYKERMGFPADWEKWLKK